MKSITLVLVSLAIILQLISCELTNDGRKHRSSMKSPKRSPLTKHKKHGGHGKKKHGGHNHHSNHGGGCPPGSDKRVSCDGDHGNTPPLTKTKHGSHGKRKRGKNSKNHGNNHSNHGGGCPPGSDKRVGCDGHDKSDKGKASTRAGAKVVYDEYYS